MDRYDWIEDEEFGIDSTPVYAKVGKEWAKAARYAPSYKRQRKKEVRKLNRMAFKRQTGVRRGMWY
jgi:hypothetical protein